MQLRASANPATIEIYPTFIDLTIAASRFFLKPDGNIAAVLLAVPIQCESRNEFAYNSGHGSFPP
jgi:hypothetical protein